VQHKPTDKLVNEMTMRTKHNLGTIEVWKLVEQDPGELSEEQMLKTKKNATL
jgi:hypothetical protein